MTGDDMNGNDMNGGPHMNGGEPMNDTTRSLAPYHLQRALRHALPAPASAEAGEQGLVTDLLNALFRRWRVIASTVMLLVGATTFYCLFTTPWYMGDATVLIEPKTLQVLNSPSQPTPAQDALANTKYDYYQTQFSLLRSRQLVERVIRELGLAHDKRFTATPLPANAPADAPIPPAMVSQDLKQLPVLPVRGTRLVDIQFLATDATLAASVANAHARLFVKVGMERLYESTEQIRDFLQTKLVELQDRRQEAESKLLKFQSEHNLLPLDISKAAATERFMALNRRLTAAEAERITLEAQYQLVQKHEYDSLPAVLASPLIQKLREDYDRLDVEHALMAAKFRPTYPKLQQLSGQLAHAQAMLREETTKVVDGIQANYLAAQGTVDQLKEELAAQRATLLERKDVEGEFLTLTRDVETTRALYDNLLARLKDLTVAGSADASNITITEPAMPALNPAWPTTKLFLLLSTVVGLVLGTGLAFLYEALDRRVHDTRDLARATGLGMLAVVPDYDKPLLGSFKNRVRRTVSRSRRQALDSWKRLGHMAFGNDAAVLPSPLGTPPFLLGNGTMPPRAEAYRTLRTALLLAPASPQALVITSAGASEGKSTTAINVAAALARCGATVLLIDGDLRLPRCHQALDTPVGPGLTDFLAGELPEAPIGPTHVDNLSFLPAGRTVPNTAELLASEPMAAFLRQMREQWNFIVIDSPPLLAVSDGLLLASLADGVVLVAQRGKSRQDRLRVALERLQRVGARSLGVVLNRGGSDDEYTDYRRIVRKVVGSGRKRPSRTDNSNSKVHLG